MNTIGSIIDMDGFIVNKKFYCKELGMLRINEEVAISYHFKMPFRWMDLNDKDRKNCSHLIKNVHKLPLYTANSLPPQHLEDIVKDFYDSIGKSPIAYKGGSIEANLLRKLNIPSVNLEIYGCPKAEYLFNNMVWLETCGKHIGTDPYLHCPKTEVEAFGEWLKTILNFSPGRGAMGPVSQH